MIFILFVLLRNSRNFLCAPCIIRIVNGTGTKQKGTLRKLMLFLNRLNKIKVSPLINFISVIK